MVKRLAAAQEILSAQQLDRATFESLRKLLSGIDAKLDTALAAAGKAFKNADQLIKGDVLELVLESIPDVTPEDKKRKKAFLLFLKFWNDLKDEVSRVEKEVGHPENILAKAKGPLGIVTLIAVGVVAYKATGVTVHIQSTHCSAKLPAKVILPPVFVTVDATGQDMRVAGYGVSYSVSTNASVVFDGMVLNGATTTIDLGSQKEHTLVVQC